MKIKGKPFDAPKPVDIFVNSGSEVAHLKAQAILDYDEFDQLCPAPKPKEVIRPGGKRGVDPNDPKFKKAMDDYGSLKTYWMIIKSLEATEGLEWDTVDLKNPDTWKNIETELTQAFTPFGQVRIMNAVLQANGLDEAMLSQARDSFLA